jgi:hypothetical protein
MRKVLKWGSIIVLAILLGIQLIQPDRSNPAVDESMTIYAHLNVPPEVKSILERSCYDCHTHNTKWPWYSYVAPVSWLIAGDVKTGRANLNMSLWGEYNKRKRISKLDLICDELREDAMPIKPYRLLHPDAALSPAEVDLICNWVDTERDRLMEESDSSSTATPTK